MIAVAIASTRSWRSSMTIARPGEARRSAHYQHGRCAAEALVNAPRRSNITSPHHPLAGNRSPTALMELAYRPSSTTTIHQVDPQQPDHADHAGDRSGRPRQDGGRLQVAPRDPGQNYPGLVSGRVRRARQQPRRDGRHAEATENVLNVAVVARRRCCTSFSCSESTSTATPSAIWPYNAWIDPILADEWEMIG
jgi:hypothetical protein